MHIPAVTHAPAATQVSPSAVSAAVRQQANNDGDGRTGAAALNDGDAAARVAAQQVKAQQPVDVKA
jgi:hypothetical protein